MDFKKVLGTAFGLVVIAQTPALASSPETSPSARSQAESKDTAADLTLKLFRVRKLRPNAYFPDITRHQGAMIATYREASEHSDRAFGKVVILKSDDDGESWKNVALLELQKTDLRDPRFCCLADGRLMLNGGIGAKPGKGSWQGKRRGSFVAFSNDGVEWSRPREILGGRDEWLWRCTAHSDGYAYGIVKEQGEGRYRNLERLQYSRLVRTKNGIDFEVIAELQNGDIPNEATIRFAPDNSAYIIHRMNDYALFGKSPPPYKSWVWHHLGRQVGGPNLIRLPDGQWLVGGRALRNGNKIMQLGQLDVVNGRYHPLIDLPSGGDCSYPGFLVSQNKLWVIYYSSHEGATNLYLAELTIQPA